MHSIYAKTKENDLPFLVAVKHSPPPPLGRMRMWTDYSDVVGFAYALPYMAERPGWDATVDISLYLSDDVVGVGLGTELLKVLLDALATRKNEDGSQRIREVLAAVALNPFEGEDQKDSAAFYRKQGFVQSGTLKAVGRKFEKWIDVSIFQKSIVGRLEEIGDGSDDIESDESEESEEDEAGLKKSIMDELEKERIRSDNGTSEEGDGIYEVEDIKGRERKREKNRMEGYDP